jgi:hypothetical protein
VLTWVHRIARIQVRERDLFGHWASRWRVIRTSNRGGTQNQDVSKPVPVAVRYPDSPLLWSVPLPDSPQSWQQRKASNKGAAVKPERT